MGPIQSIEDIIGMLRRRMLPILTVSIVGALVTLFFALSMPRSYETAAVIQVQLPRVADDPARSPIQAPALQRVRQIEQQLTTRATIMELIARHGLFADAAGLTDNEKVVLARTSIRFDNITTGATPFGTEPEISALLVIVTLDDGQKAANVANDIAGRIVDLSARRQSDRTRDTLEFYALEEQRVATMIAGLEAEITAFKNDNLDALPEGMENRRDELGRLNESLRALDAQIGTLRSERLALSANRNPRAIEARQIEALDQQIGLAETQRQQVIERRTALLASVARAPAVETALGTFQRRLSQLQDQYSVVNRRKAEAETTQRLEANQQSERFELLEPAIVPDYPQSSGRKKLMVFGIFASVMAGLGLALGLEILNPVLRTSRQMQRALDLRPVIAIPELPSDASVRRRRARGLMAGYLVTIGAAAAWVIRAVTSRTGDAAPQAVVQAVTPAAAGTPAGNDRLRGWGPPP